MDSALRSTIVRIARSCNRRCDFENHVRDSLGSEFVADALALYDQIYDDIWGKTYPTPGTNLKAKPRKFEFQIRGVSIPLSTFSIALTAIAELIAFLFPPYTIPLPQGLTRNLGFHFLFNPPQIGKIEATVWAVEFLGILIIGTLCFVFARFIERLSEGHLK